LTFILPAFSIIAEGIKIKGGNSEMKTVQISLNSIDKVKSFVNDITKFDYDFDLVSGRYVIDAKSIMGIFSLDLSKPIDLNIHAEDGTDEVMEALKPYIM
jgi:phosphotransferase system HPr-like phosphotransfer protein